MKLKLLSEKHVWGGKNLVAVRAQGGRPLVSDLCLGLGSWGRDISNHDNYGDTLLAETTSYGSASVWHQTGDSNSCGKDDPKNSIRPIIEGAEAEQIYRSATVKKVEKINGYFLEVIQAGAYPQDVDWNYGALEDGYQKGILPTTGKSYTFNGVNVENDYGYYPHRLPEFELNGQKYVRAIVSSFADCLYLDGRRAWSGYPCWYRVQPVEWLCDPSGILISRRGLVGGIPFSAAKDYVGNTLSREIENTPSGPRRLEKSHSTLTSQDLLRRMGRSR